MAGYAKDAATLIPRYESVSAAEKLRHVEHLLPQAPARALDIGAGTGVDAAWLASKGHLVLAVEPTEAFRTVGQALHPSPAIRWLDDSLPALGKVLALSERFDLVLACAVWAHLAEALHAESLSNLAVLMAPQATLPRSLRSELSARGSLPAESHPIPRDSRFKRPPSA